MGGHSGGGNQAGHLWNTLLGWDVNPHFDPLHVASNVLIVVGFFVLAGSWRVLHAAQTTHTLATSGWYARMRHPQYSAFILIMFGFLLQWPTLPTLVMFPILVWIYVRLARREEEFAVAEFGAEYRSYRERTPGFVPRMPLRPDPDYAR